MGNEITVVVNGKAVAVPEGASALVAMMISGAACRRSVRGELRGPLCGMGICFECRARIDGVPHLRSCQILCRPGMEINIDE
ncbi:MAG: (2Fe-2S)-binding protein [Acidobacteria bacterium]|nr:(2Fe-2S)-binding protein [Acidobacteriota bacterium]